MTAPFPRPIALVGMPGAGKTSVGRALAARLGRRFVDSDALVVAAAGCSVGEILAREGEAGFRAREREAVAAALDEPGIVLATGGGAMTDAGTRALLLEKAVTLWLEADAAVLAARLGGAGGRPLLAGGDLVATLERLLVERAAGYALADQRVDTKALTIDEVAERIVLALGPPLAR